MRQLEAPSPARRTSPRRALGLLVSCAVALPMPAAADDTARRLAIGILGAAIASQAVRSAPRAQGAARASSSSASSSSGARAAPADALPMTVDARMQVQESLRALGHYDGAIDGAYGPGTRASIAAYQRSIGASATGRLAAGEIHDLVAASPAWRVYPDGDPALFASEIGRDLDGAGLRRLQAGLNAAGYDAGPVDGAMGRATGRAIADYKRGRGLAGGPFATARLLAAVEGGVHVGAARRMMGGGAFAGAAVEAPVELRIVDAAEPAAPFAAAPVDPALASRPPEILTLTDLRTGQDVDEIGAELAARFDAPLAVETAGAAAFAGTGTMTAATRWTTADWPAPMSQSFVALHDLARPEIGAIAIFRTLRLPDGIDFDASILPRMIEDVGTQAHLPGSATWIAEAAARAGGGSGCGTLAMPIGADGRWAYGSGPRLAGAMPTAPCGDVLAASSQGGALHMGLWSTGALAGASAGGATALPEIDF